jgi:tetratricopeptide (TPR) repeat protein
MKIKLIYIYGVIILVAALYLIFFTGKDHANTSNNSNKEMPQDDIHKGLTQSPNKENVEENVKHQLDMLKKEVDKNPKDTLAIREYADILAAAHKPDQAIIYYNKVLNVNPARTDILFSLAFVYYNMKDYPNSEKVTNRIFLYEKNNLQARYNLGAIAATIGDIEKAKLIWNKLVKEHPNTEASKLAQSSLSRL